MLNTSEKVIKFIIATIISLAILGFGPFFGFMDTLNEINRHLSDQVKFESTILELEKELFQLQISQSEFISNKSEYLIPLLDRHYERFEARIGDYEKYTGSEELARVYKKQKNDFTILKNLTLREGIEDVGLIGQYRERIHKIEKIIRKTKNQEAKIALLQLRRDEKDYLLRRKVRYINKMVLQKNKLRKILPAGEKKLLDEYYEIFVQIIENREEIDKSLKSWKESLRALALELNDVIFIHDNKVNETTFALKQKKTIYSILMLLFGVINIFGVCFLSYLFYRYSRSIVSLNEELKTQIDKNEAMKERLLAQEKLASLGNLTSGIAHELKNPLNLIAPSAQLLEKTLNIDFQEVRTKLISQRYLSDEDRSYILGEFKNLSNMARIISEGSQKANIILKSMADLSNTALKKEDVCHIDELFESARLDIENMNPDLCKGIDFILNGDSKVKVIGNKKELEKVFFHLLSNAYFFTQKRIERGDEFDPLIRVSFVEDEKKVSIEVIDNGIGIPSEDVEKVFEPFFTTKKTGEGVGLSLSFCHDIISNHNGTLICSNGNPATFKISLSK